MTRRYTYITRRRGRGPRKPRLDRTAEYAKRDAARNAQVDRPADAKRDPTRNARVSEPESMNGVVLPSDLVMPRSVELLRDLMQEMALAKLERRRNPTAVVDSYRRRETQFMARTVSLTHYQTGERPAERDDA